MYKVYLLCVVIIRKSEMRIDLQLDKPCINVYGMQYLLINLKNLHADISASMQFDIMEFQKLGYWIIYK